MKPVTLRTAFRMAVANIRHMHHAPEMHYRVSPPMSAMIEHCRSSIGAIKRQRLRFLGRHITRTRIIISSNKASRRCYALYEIKWSDTIRNSHFYLLDVRRKYRPPMTNTTKDEISAPIVTAKWWKRGASRSGAFARPLYVSVDGRVGW